MRTSNTGAEAAHQEFLARPEVPRPPRRGGMMGGPRGRGARGRGGQHQGRDISPIPEFHVPLLRGAEVNTMQPVERDMPHHLATSPIINMQDVRTGRSLEQTNPVRPPP